MGKDMNDYTRQIEQRNIWIAILLSVITCGIYALYWMFVLTQDWNTVTEAQGQKPGTTPGLVVILSIVTCGLYSIYYWYYLSKRVARVRDRNGNALEDDTLLCVILSVLGLGVISAAIQQNNLNMFVEYGM
jgi:hypothetical protein